MEASSVAFIVVFFIFSILAFLVYQFVKIWMERNALKSQMESIAFEYAKELFSKWRSEEMEEYKRQLEEEMREKMEIKIREYLMQKEAEIRKDAIKRHEAVVMGKVTEHFIPYLPEFRYNPKDARFIGAPIDFVVFDGLSEGNLRKIVFIEVKAGRSPTLNKRERQVRDVIEKRKVYWEIIHRQS